MAKYVGVPSFHKSSFGKTIYFGLHNIPYSIRQRLDQNIQLPRSLHHALELSSREIIFPLKKFIHPHKMYVLLICMIAIMILYFIWMDQFLKWKYHSKLEVTNRGFKQSITNEIRNKTRLCNPKQRSMTVILLHNRIYDFK